MGSEDGPEGPIDVGGEDEAEEDDNDDDGEMRGGAPADGAGAGVAAGKPNKSSGKSTSSIAKMLHGAALYNVLTMSALDHPVFIFTLPLSSVTLNVYLPPAPLYVAYVSDTLFFVCCRDARGYHLGRA